MPSKTRSVSFTRIVAILICVAGFAVTGTAPKHRFTEHEKAFYADSQTLAFVRPGLVLKITSADISSDGVIRVRFKLTDPQGLALDRTGVNTPGPVALSFVAGFIPSGDRQYRTYTTRVFTPANRPSVTDPWMDAGGTYTTIADGVYTYTFATKAPAGFDRTVTHSVGGQASRDLTSFGMSKYADNDVYNFVPDGSAVNVVRDVVRTATCNARCHDPLAVHGQNRIKVELCVMCHQPQNQDPYGGTLSFPVMIHELHRGKDLPSVKAGTPLKINNNDFSDVVFPANVINCQVCHDPASGAAQADAWLKQPSRAVCGACHNDVNFATGEGHVDLPMFSDNQCSMCHIPEGETEFDFSIKGAHTDPRFSRDLPGTVFDILQVDNAMPGKNPTVTFTVKDQTGTALDLSKMDRVNLVIAGPTTDYAGMVSEDARSASGSNGLYSYTFKSPIPAGATGTFSVGIEGYKTVKLLPGTLKEKTVRDTGMNKVTYFSVDGSKFAPRRTVVQVEKCNACHLKLEAHGGMRNDTEHCVQCHNPNQTDAAQRPKDQMPAQLVTFKTMVHRIHTGKNLQIEYTVYGFGGRPNDFTDVVFPGDRRDCDKCHVNSSQQLPLGNNQLNVVNPRGRVDPMGPATAACMGCHTSQALASHVASMTTSLGESCDVCHGKNAEFSVDRVHAR